MLEDPRLDRCVRLNYSSRRCLHAVSHPDSLPGPSAASEGIIAGRISIPAHGILGLLGVPVGKDGHGNRLRWLAGRGSCAVASIVEEELEYGWQFRETSSP